MQFINVCPVFQIYKYAISMISAPEEKYVVEHQINGWKEKPSREKKNEREKNGNEISFN